MTWLRHEARHGEAAADAAPRLVVARLVESVVHRQAWADGGSALRRTRQHPTAAIAAAGFAASTLIVVAGGLAGTVRVAIPLTTWFGTLARSSYGPGRSPVPGLLLLTGIFSLVLLWLGLVRRPHPATSSEARVWAIAGAWSLPLMVGPPLLSSDVYTYAAQGLLVDHGLDPYSVGPSALGNVRAVAAVDPAWRSVPSPYGPLATRFEQLAVVLGGGGPLGAVIILRLLAVGCVIAIGLLAADLASPRRRLALILTVLNPLVLLQVVSAAHLEGLVCALVLGALVAVRRGNPTLGIVLACAAGAVKAPAFVAVLAIIAWQRQGQRTRQAWSSGARDATVAMATCAALTTLVPHGWGWVNALETPALGYTPGAPASLVGDLFKPIIQPASFDDLSAGGRSVALLAAGCIVAYLTLTAQRRPLEATVGLGLIGVAMLSPVIYPWYVLWGALCLTPIAQRRHRDLLVLACAIGSVVAVPGLPRLVVDLISAGLAACITIIVVSPNGRATQVIAPLTGPARGELDR
jgi:hypothetical protein